ncbi:guanylate kinase [Dissulfurirhabdus thermomarina]|uniref:Guanylate kinase n=1 Tax=Dissulfurirhabdus thermomarina TaxID=1765737 RepID=A0A6N9TKK0_DISTH|nr:guanylate kinase [Dissulfurirhabdus thermomarina]NDY41639.1 guanylate kinase [Dissulfurirhabdus thermomarina]NMX23318.1 guanylate kinase [Dissulfurirhabdus thermomarina]
MEGDLFVISAPSGAGKTTLCRRLLAEVAGLDFSVSHTTRPPRPGEVDGRDYHFVDREVFEAMRARGDFLEWAEVHGNLYGTSRQAVSAALAAGRDVLLDIDVQGAREIRRVFPGACYVFILPPSLEALEARLRGRGSEDEAAAALRLANARRELHAASEYDYVVVNDELDAACEGLRAIVTARRLRSARVLAAPGLRAALGLG